MQGSSPSVLKIILASVLNGIVAMTAIFLVAIPVIGFILFLIDLDFQDAIDTLMGKLDIIIVIFIIGVVFEIIDRIIRGIKKSKVIAIIRDKADRW